MAPSSHAGSKATAMFKSYLTTALRNLWKTKFYHSLNIAGLALGLATCLLIILYILDELAYDRFHANADRIYRVNIEIKFGENYFDVAQSPALLGNEAVKAYPQIEQYTRMRRRGNLLVKKDGINITEDRIAFGDSTLFNVFSLKMLSGDPGTALQRRRSIVITETIARKYFNRVDVAGQYMTINDSMNYMVTGVIKDIPRQSHFNFDFFLPFAESSSGRNDDWMSQNFNTYLLLKKNANILQTERDLNAMLSRFVAPELKTVLGVSMETFTRQGSFVKCSLTPLTAIHLHSNRVGEIDTNGSIQYVYILGAVALFILLISCINFINLFTARSSNRAKEVGIRKVLGSQRKSLVQQFLTESVLISFLALIISLLIVWPMLPFFNHLTGKDISFNELFDPMIAGILLLLTLFVGLLAGSYPAFLLSAFHPIEVLKGKFTKGFKGGWLRDTLVTFQFSISMVLIIGTLVIYSQLGYIRSKDIGFDRQQVVVIRNTNVLKGNAAAFKNELLEIPGIDKVTLTGFLPVNGARNNDAYFASPALSPNSAISMQSWFVDDQYIPTLNIRIKEGRNFSATFPTDSSAIILNEAAATFLGAGNLLNKKLYMLDDIKTKRVREFHVVGIIKNFNFSSLRDAVAPLALVRGSDKNTLAFRVNTADISSVITQVKERWKSFGPSKPFDYSFMDEEFNRLYATEKNTGEIFFSFALLAIVIACLGLFALAAYAAEQRVKEIGIRKVFGASGFDIVRLLSGNFIKLVLAASLLATPIAWYAMNKWLQGFAYRITIGWQVFAVAITGTLLIALLTVGFQAIKAAIANPMKNLRTE
jgi:putative ABC transport system permease protein